jgi:hypothetical protein
MIKRNKERSFNPVKVGLILVFVFLCLDVGLRFVIPSKQDELNVNRPVEYQDLFVSNHFGRLKPNLDVTLNMKGFEFHVATNSFGLRSPDTTIEKPNDVKRIAVLGDSIGFGMLMEESESYPAILREKLKNHSSNYEVINFSAPGFSTVQGGYLYQTYVNGFQPDILILSYGLYDAKLAPVSDESYLQFLQSIHALQPKSDFSQKYSQFSMIGYWLNNRSQGLMKEKLENAATSAGKGQNQLRVKQATAKNALHNIIQEHKLNGKEVILLDANIETHFNQFIYHELHNEDQVQLLSIHDFLDHSGKMDSKKIRYQKSLAYPGITKQENSSVSIIFRVYAPGQSQLFLRVQSTDGAMNQWFEFNDLGSNGDEKTGDEVWSIMVPLENPTDVFYKFYNKKDSDGAVNEEVSNEKEKMSLTVESNVRLIKSTEQSPGYQTVMPLEIYGTLPDQEYRMPEHPEYPSKEIHQSIANRLYYLITEREKQ